MNICSECGTTEIDRLKDKLKAKDQEIRELKQNVELLESKLHKQEVIHMQARHSLNDVVAILGKPVFSPDY
jgi:cell division protein FtsB